ncbi:hypothetical protein GCM10007103_31730 [Salinimicrobium marinum]|uniref:Uncharacterized protein n=1 Tax=Salinimicrobium marinum TaxID=680283 RepID=A0A918SKS8_9FLAO|nr:hypothetical protein [Salinimicrobium marinum]GHA48498.1 hypothetical protein GCM10007103_31730 [Salinimicrobium marinum]
MKRYLIYGFLTILIITLNFSFIIVLVTDDVRINYQVLFLLWILVLLAAGGLAYLEKTRKKKEKLAAAAQKPATPDEYLKNPHERTGPSNIYKNKCIKKARIKLAEDLTTKITPGFFGGYVVNEDYSNETVQAVYKYPEQLLGFISKKKEQLCENLQVLYNEPVECWGNIFWDDYEKRFIAKVHIPVLYSEPETNRFKKMIRLKDELLHLENSSDGYDVYTLLEKAENFHYLQQSEIAPPSLDHSINPEILPRLCNELLESRQWEELYQLKKYPVMISQLEQPQKKEVLSAIQKAEQKLKT